MAERIFKFVSSTLTEIGSRDPARRYKYVRHPTLAENIYLEFTTAEETARDTEEAQPSQPFSGFGRAAATRTSFSIANNTATAVPFTSEIYDNALFHDTATNTDRFTIPESQAGLYDLKAHVKFNESTVGLGGVVNVGDRSVQIRVGASPIVSTRQRASAASDTEVTLAADLVLSVGDIVRVGVLQNSGGTMDVDVRFSLRRVDS